MKKTTMLVALVVALTLSGVPAQAGEYVFGVHPFKKPNELAQMFKPLMEYLGKVTGATMTFRSAPNYDATKQAIARGEFDVFYVGPSLFAELTEEAPGKARLVGTVLNNGKPSFKGVIVVKEGSTISSLADLKGKKFAFGDHGSTLSAYVPAHMLIKAGVFDALAEHKFLGSHDNVAQAVLKGFFDAGAMQPAVLKQYQGLKVLAESDPVPEHCIAVGGRIDDATFKKIQEALVKAPDLQVFKAINPSLTGFAVTKPGDYAALGKLMKAVDAKLPKK
jgi:phosphonate transport system substrate-binding protein